MDISGIDKNSRVGIIGAGPAGLSTAWFLGKHDFRNVTVLEKLGRILNFVLTSRIGCE
jgi:2-polyprenyl-6-methoxyphenol hydroxylase-like FAD-dependent oxidoreductase